MKFNYDELLEKGFERIEVDDSVWEAKYGFPYFIVSMGNEQYGLDWDIHTQEVEFQTLGKNYTILKREKVTSLAQLDACIRMIKGTNILSNESIQILLDFDDVHSRLRSEIKSDMSSEMNVLLIRGYIFSQEIKSMLSDIYISEQDAKPLFEFIQTITKRLEELEGILIANDIEKIDF